MPHKEVQSDLPEPTEEEENVYLKAAERIKLHPKVPPEPSAYLRGSNYSRPWILQDGRAVDEKGSEMRGKYQVLPKIKPIIGIRKRMMTNFFWEQVLQEVISEIANPELTTEYCTEYDSNYKKEDFKPRLLEETVDKNMHLKYPLYGTGSSAVTFYSENIKKQGPGEILEKFRSCQYFTKPMAERLDNGWVL